MTEKDRIAVEHDDDPVGDPVIMPVDELRGRQQSDDSPERTRPEPATTRRDPRASSTQPDAHQDRVRRRAVQKVVSRLKQQGYSDDFIATHHDLIMERVREELRTGDT